MQAADRYPEWVTCHQVTRSAAGALVRCPRRGLVLTDDCLRCRFLTFSSIERSTGPWCEVPATPLGPAVERPVEPPLDAPREAPFELPPRAPRPGRRPWPLDLPLVAAGSVAAASGGGATARVAVGPGRRAPAVRPAEPVPSG